MMARSLLTGWDEMTDKAMPDDSVRPADAGSDGNDGDDASRGGGARAAQAASPLITAIEIENFKGIGRPMRVDLRPVTLLFGNNSAGKSTVLHALCYAHEILSHGNVDVHETELGGRQIDLGGYRRFVHQHNPEREVRPPLRVEPRRMADTHSASGTTGISYTRQERNAARPRGGDEACTKSRQYPPERAGSGYVDCRATGSDPQSEPGAGPSRHLPTA